MRARLLAPAVLTATLTLAGCGAPMGNPFAMTPVDPAETRPAAGSSDLAATERTGLAATETASADTPMRVRTDTYADDLCSGLERFGASYQQARTERREALYGSPHRAKRAMLAYVDDVDAALRKTIAATAAWGVPDMKNGEQLAGRVRTALEQVQETNATYRPRIDALRSKDRRFAEVARALLGESEADMSAALLHLDWFDAGSAFRSAFNSSRTCKAL